MDMQYRPLGRAGLKLSALSLGTWVTFNRQVDEPRARNLIACAWDHGVNFFDSSETYAAGQAEVILGKALSKLAYPRDSYCVSSKVFFGCVAEPKPTQRGLSRKHVSEACHQALKRLQVDYLDLYFCHRPDPDTPIAETVWAMDTLIRQGKVLYWGTSEWPAEAIREAHAVAGREHLHAPSMEQPQYNLLHRERVETEYAPLYEEYGMGTTIWSPLASGVLTGKYVNGIPEGSRLSLESYKWLQERVDMKRVSGLLPIAKDLNMSPAQFALAWCLKNPHVSTVMLGVTRREQLEENITALEAVDKLDASVMQKVNTALTG